MPRQIITYDPIDRPDAEVLVDGDWLPAEVDQWTQRDDGTWWAMCRWHRGTDTYLDEFPAGHVRRDDTDYSQGRG